MTIKGGKSEENVFLTNDMKKSKVAAVMIILFCGLIMTSCGENDDKYKRKLEGNTVHDITAGNENNISVDSGNVVFDLADAKYPFPDELVCKVKKTFTLTNMSAVESYVPVARTMVLNVVRIEIDSESIKEFKSGSSIYVDGNEVMGLIYVNSTEKKLLEKSVYDSALETIENIDTEACYSEAAALYGVNNEEETDNIIPGEGEKSGLYVIDEENGEPSLCTVIYNLHFDEGESHVISYEDEITASMKRPTAYSVSGTTYEFSYIGEGINSFSNVGRISYVFNLPEDEKLPLISVDAAKFYNDGTWNVESLGKGKSFCFEVGKKLSESEVADINSAYGIGRILYNVVEVLTAAFVIASAAYLVYSIKRRNQSGISKKRYS